ncbi:MAG: PD-(D/E)XK nuclease family protein [Eubacteriales bacterium]|nr:PD-(D/E)XK nuclease family protein [Eubacteriales bacterium]
MSFSFCYGPSGSGKSSCLRRLIIARAQQSLRQRGKDRTKYIVVVPEQYTMQTQRELVQDHPSHVLMNIDVLSFGRLAHRVFEETGEDPRAVLDDIGKSLLLRRVAARCEKDLQILQRGIHRPGMIDEVKSVLSEFMQYGIDEDRIEAMAAYAKEHGQNALSARLMDVRRLYAGFRKEQEDRYVTSEETLDLLAGAIPRAESLQGSVIVFDGFTGFTTVQYRVVMALLRCAKEVIFSFTSSQDRGPAMAVTAADGPAGREEDLFYLSRHTVADILRMASAEGIPHGQDIDLEKEGGLPRFRDSRVLAHLERHLFRYPEVPFSENHAGETEEGLQLFAATTPQEEVRRIFAQVRRTIARTGCAYRDFAIVTADLETYGDLFAREAVRSGIPVYVDRTSSAFHNILIEGIRSVLQISAESFSYESVFRYLRSGLSSVTAQEADLLENYCLANGIRGRRKWAAPFDAACEEARRKFLRETSAVTGLEDAADSPARRARTAAERTREVYAFLLACDAQARMDALSQRFGAEGDVVREKQYSQIFRTVIDLLDQVYDLAGQERISARDYMELLEAGFAQIRLGTIPQRVDRILVGDIERTRLTQIRHLFFAGVNEGSIPRGASRGGILSDMDREFLAAGGAALAPTPRQQMFSQRLYLYMNMTKPSQSLTVSYARISQKGESLRPSYLISVLRALFPALPLRAPELDPAPMQIGGQADGLHLLADRLRVFVENAAGGFMAADRDARREFTLLYGFYTSPQVLADPAVHSRVRRLREAALYRYRPELLREAAKAIYGNVLTGGISRMETAARCLLRQHLRYGLRLRERDLYEFAVTDAGTILHEALHLFDSRLRAEGLSWADFSREDAERLTDAALEEEAAVYRNLLLYKSARDQNRLGIYRRRLLRTVDTLQYQLRKGDLVPVASELGFGTGEGELPAIRFDLGSGRLLRLVGRIDRVDLFEEDGRRYLRIMDYKSGKNELDPDLIRRGLQLQLISYMDALLEAGEIPGAERSAAGPDPDDPDRKALESIPAAMLYYKMDDPAVDMDPEELLQGGEQLREMELKKIRKELKPTGLVYAEETSVDHLDKTRDRYSDVIPVGRLTGGGFTAASHVIDAEGYRELSRAASEAVCRLANGILDGEITAAPAVLDKRRTACDYCPYKDSCGFDLRTPGYAFRRE